MIIWVIAGLLGLATGLRIGWALVNKQSLVSTAMILALGILGLVAALNWQPLTLLLDTLLHWPNIAMGLSQVALVACAAALLSALPAAAQGSARPAAQGKPTVADAKKFAEQVNTDLKRLWVKQATAEWIKSTYITDDTERNAAFANEEVLAYMNQAIKDSRRFEGLKLDPDTARTIHLLKVSSAIAARASPWPACTAISRSRCRNSHGGCRAQCFLRVEDGGDLRGAIPGCGLPLELQLLAE